MSITLRQLEYFLASARAGSMVAASAKLHVSPAAVSLGIAQLEKTLGVQLFLRVPRQELAVTSAGRKLLGQAASIVAETEAFVAGAATAGPQLGGTIHVDCFDTLAPFVVPQLLTAVADRHPDLHIEFDEGSSGAIQARLLDGSAELAVLYGLELGPLIRTEPLWTIRPYILLPQNHGLAHRSSIRLVELENDPMVLLDAPPSRFHSISSLERLGISPRVERVTKNFETLRSLVGRGHGWAMLVQRPANSASFEGRPVVAVEIEDAVEPAPVVVASAAAAEPSTRTRAVVALLRSHVSAPN